MPTNYNGEQSPLEKAAIIARSNLIPKNLYNSEDASNQYSPTHTRAISDNTTPVNGKGSGNFLDIENYKGVGGTIDIFGNQNFAGSGREPLLTNNSATWGYGPVGLGMSNYTAPDTSANKGQVVI
jgi:hypothetical protein